MVGATSSESFLIVINFPGCVLVVVVVYLFSFSLVGFRFVRIGPSRTGVYWITAECIVEQPMLHSSPGILFTYITNLDEKLTLQSTTAIVDGDDNFSHYYVGTDSDDIDNQYAV